MISGLSSLLKKYNMAVVDGLLYPLLACKRFGNTMMQYTYCNIIPICLLPLAVNHSDMISKLIKDVLTEDQRSQLFK